MRFFDIHQDFKSYRPYLLPGTEVLFSDLTGCDLTGLDLSNCIFFACRLDFSDFSKATLRGCSFEYCIISHDDKGPSFDATIGNPIITNCNFSLDNKELKLSYSPPYQQIIENILVIEDIEYRSISDIPVGRFVWDSDTITLHEVYGYAHLFSRNHTYTQGLLFSIYEQIIFDQRIVELPDDRSNDLQELIFTQLRDTFIEKDVCNLFEAHCTPVDQEIKLKVLRSIYGRVNSPVKSDQYLGLQAMIKYHIYEDEFVELVPFEELCSIILSQDGTLRHKSIWMINEVLSFYILDESMYRRLEEILKPFLTSALESEVKEVQFDVMNLLEKRIFFNWDMGLRRLIRIRDEHPDEKIRTKAKEIFDNYSEEDS